ncbi:polysaccharide chain length determinant protein, PEP-CTERM locus subfamily [Desulfovibrio sp. X2]|uniref:XrtA system polysaccharide chain length determinant n=1 Tax=Desulfovibrio sp. X2 TaxID=941449 RepID=UPI00035895B6|nr:XrtA system polysaccharide chain length determinant [Desulfovibrio sp. X2]EPR37247.1 polysaccharide chain length determinant protein, PEP-CTERM locus subfamily [Desulfovibrio sp. X2]
MNSASLGSFEHYLRLVALRKRLFVTVALAVMTLAVVVSYSLPKVYEARSTVFIEQSVINDLVRGIAVTPSMEAKIKVLSVSMLSRTMLLKVLRLLDKDVAFQNDADREDYIKDLRSRIGITLDEKRGVFFISFRDQDPAYARDLVNTLTQAYIEQSTSSKREESLEATKFLGEQIKTFKRRIDEAQANIDKYKADHMQLLSVDEGLLRHEIDQAENELDSIRLQQMKLEAQVNIAQGRSPKQQRLAQMQNQLSAMLSTYTEDHPSVIRLRNEIAAYKKSGGGGGGGGGDDLPLLRVQIEANKQLEAKQQAIIDKDREMLHEIPQTRTELNDLLSKKENESVIYNQLVSRYGQSEVSKQMEIENKAATFRILDPAITPKIPVSPKRLQIILGGVGGGLALAFGLLVLLDKLKGSVNATDELKRLKIKVLAIIPAMPKPEEEARQRRADRRFLVAAGAYFSVVVGIAVMEALHVPLMEKVMGRFF